MSDRNHEVKRDTARALIVHDGKILLIERFRPGMHYFSAPGGGVEPGETLIQAVKREVYEETSLHVDVEREVYVWHQGPHEHHFFICTYKGGEPKLHSASEEASNGPDNIHSPRWVDFEELSRHSFGYWEPLKERFLHDLKNGFPLKVVHLTA